MAERKATIERRTAETSVAVTLDLDGRGEVVVATGIPFFDHMLSAFARHGRFDLKVAAQGDLDVDAHHTVEDVGIVLGQALLEAMGDKRGIERFASPFIAMDEALVLAACDISGRGQLHYRVNVPIEIIGTFDTTLVKEFFIALATNATLTLHLQSFAGENSHHIIEATFKAAGRALSLATRIDERFADMLPTTKGML